MPYISAEDVKKKRQEIRKAFPKFKISVTGQSHSSIHVDILEAPFNMLTEKELFGYEPVNHFYIEEHFKNTPKIMEVLLKIKDIISKGQKEIVYDGDYGSVPNFYINMRIGRWDRPFKIKEK